MTNPMTPESMPQDVDLLIGTADFKTIERNGQTSFVVGEKAKDTGSKQIPQVFINCEVGDKLNRKFVSIPIHEIPLLRRMHRTFGGTVDILSTGYAPGLKQVQWLTAAQVYEELKRLAGDLNAEIPIPGAYILPPRNKDDKPRDVFSEVYGVGREGQERFLKGMVTVAAAWFKLATSVRAEMRKVTVDDIEAIIDLVDPRLIASTIDLPKLPDLPELTDEPQTTGEPAGGKDLEPADHALVQFLTESRAQPEDIAKRLASVVANHQGALGDEQWKQVLGDRDHHMRRKALQTALDDFKKPAPQLAT